MRLRFRILAAAPLLLLSWSPAAASELGTAPHFLMLADRERIVLFSDGPIAGALADRRADGSIVVTVPKVAAGAAIAGREFDDSGSGGSGRTKVRVTSTAQGDALLEISGAGAVERVHAYGTTKPARLTIDLLHPGAQERSAEAVKPPTKAAAATGESGASKSAPAAAEVATATATSAPAADSVRAVSAPVAAATSVAANTSPAVSLAAAPKALPVASGASAETPRKAAAQVVSASESAPGPAAARPAAATKDVAAAGAATAAPSAATGPASAAPSAAVGPASAAPSAAVGPASPERAPAAAVASSAATHGDAGRGAADGGASSAAAAALPASQAEEAAPAAVAEAVKDTPPGAPDDARDQPAAGAHGAATPTLAQAAPAPAPMPSASPAVTAKDKARKKGKPGTSEALASASGQPVAAPGTTGASMNVGSAAAGVATPPAAGVPPAGAVAPAAANTTLVCRWRRVAGIPYCGPDPKDGIYAADLGTAEIAGLLDRARSGPTLVRLPDHGPAEAHLNADVALIRAAKSGYLLPVLVEYEQALRTYPNFADATRSRANVALIYHTLGFAPELARLARAKSDPVAPFAAVLLADLWRDREEPHDLAPLLAAGRSAGGITNCLAERVAANVAADQGKAAAFPGAFADLSKVCPRTILEDSETAWLRGRAMLLGGEAKRAAEVLPVLEDELPRRERPLLLADVVAAQDASGNVKAARTTQERLAGGTLGRRAAREARLALAARDAAEGKLGDLDGRFADLPIEDAVQTRARADAIAVGELLRGGNEIAALGMMTERKVEARSLAPADQLLLAHALRKVGLLDQARRGLSGVGAATTGRLPDGYYDELGALALAHDDAPGALEIVEQWRAARGGNPPPGAIALKARARAAKGDARGATEALEKELVPLDPVLARDVAIDLAGELRSADPALARHLAQSALVEGVLPPLEPAREAEALAALADAAEATGDRAAAQAAFTRLASELAAQPAAAGAAYRAARLAAAAPPASGGGAAPTQQAVAKAPAAAPIVDDDPLSRRIAAAGQLYQEVVAGMQGAKP